MNRPPVVNDRRYRSGDIRFAPCFVVAGTAHFDPPVDLHTLKFPAAASLVRWHAALGNPGVNGVLVDGHVRTIVRSLDEQMRVGLIPLPDVLRRTTSKCMAAVWLNSDCHRGGVIGGLPATVCLSRCRWHVSDGLGQAAVVELGNPLQGRSVPRHPWLSRAARRRIS